MLLYFNINAADSIEKDGERGPEHNRTPAEIIVLMELEFNDISSSEQQDVASANIKVHLLETCVGIHKSYLSFMLP